jgi:hypothetical protein
MDNMLNHFPYFLMNENFGIYYQNGWINIFNNLSTINIFIVTSQLPGQYINHKIEKTCNLFFWDRIHARFTEISTKISIEFPL